MDRRMEKYLGLGLEKRDYLTVKVTRGRRWEEQSKKELDLENDGRTSSLYKRQNRRPRGWGPYWLGFLASLINRNWSKALDSLYLLSRICPTCPMCAVNFNPIECLCILLLEERCVQVQSTAAQNPRSQSVSRWPKFAKSLRVALYTV